MEEKSRIARLVSIHTDLQSRRLSTATALAEKYGVSVRTIYRDVKTLLEAGIPIVTIEGKGYTLMDGYSLPPVSFTKEEALALITAERLVNASMDSSLVKTHQDAMTKVRATLNSQSKSNADLLSERTVSLSNIYQESSSSCLIDIQACIAENAVIEIEYTSQSKNETTLRIVEPQAIYHTRNNWIMIAYCKLRKDYREFRIDRIVQIKKTNDEKKRLKFDLRDYFSAVRDRIPYTPDS